MERTFPRLLKQHSENYGRSKVAMRKKEFGVWKQYAWQDCYLNVKYLALGLLSLGLESNDRVAIIGDNDPQWHWTEFATQAIGGVPLGIFSDAAISEAQYILQHSDAKFVAAKDQEQVDKVLGLKDDLPHLEKVLYWEPKGLWSYDDPCLISFKNVIEMGMVYEKAHPGVFESTIDKHNETDTAFLCYTSGTGSQPKGATLSYRSLTTAMNGWIQIYPKTMNATSDYVSNTPAAWILEQWFGIANPMLTGMMLNFPESPETVQENLREIGPRIVAYPPRLWENMASGIQAKLDDSTFLKRLVYRLLSPIGYRAADFRKEARTPDVFWKALHKMADLIIFRPLRDTMGIAGAELGFSGGTLSPDTFNFFRALGFNLKNVYALTEGGIIGVQRYADFDLESVGRPIVGVQVRIAGSGELLSKSDCNFTHYHKDSEGTRKILENGWLHTGDAGYFTEDGYIVVLDRLPDMAVLASGEKFSPTYVESRLKFSPYIRDAMVVGGRNRQYVTAILNIDFENVGRWAENHKIAYTTFNDLSQKKEVCDLVSKDLMRVNRFISELTRVRRFVNLHKEFDADEAELTRTRKLRRGYMETRYSDLIGAMYSDSESVSIEAEVKYRDGRVGKVTTSVRVNSLRTE
ncbi:MAG: AMP-binding protein [Chloroflexota bacterium]|nr:AMP-binding protein [Chloroflexota bacterium]